MSANQELNEKPVMIKVVIPRELRDKFKGLCAMNGSNMNTVLSEFIETYVASEGKVETVSQHSQ